MKPFYVCLTCKTVIGPIWDDFDNQCKCESPYDYEVVRVAPIEESFKSNNPKYMGDFDVWYKPCKRCGYDTAKSRKLDNPKCWKCGGKIERDYTDRALKISE